MERGSRWSTLLGAGGLALFLGSPTAHALTGPDYLDWACGGGGVQDSAVKANLLTLCGGVEGVRKACGVESGTPFACYSHQAKDPTQRRCSGGSVTINVTGTTGGYLGWSVTGSLTVSGSVVAEKTVARCQISPLDPSPSASGGTYVVLAGKAKLTAKFTAAGTGHIKFLGANIFGVSFKASCADDVEADIYELDSTTGCGEAQPCAEGEDCWVQPDAAPLDVPPAPSTAPSHR